MGNRFKQLITIVVLGAVLIGLWQFDALHDWWVLRTYHPSVSIAELATKAGLNSTGRRDYYLSQPEIDDKANFNHNCPVSELTLVLGCYGGQRIYILRVDRTELKGVMAVTAAHEALHAAYARLSGPQRQRVNNIIQSFYKTVHDKRLQKLIREYERSEPGELLNELHSILPTQLPHLSPELEAYYQQYFSDRERVVAAYQAYEGVFTSLQNQVTTLRQQLGKLSTQLKQLEQAIADQKTELDATNRQLSSFRSQGDIKSYNNLIPEQNREVDRYNSLVSQYRTLVDRYNQQVATINRLALEQNQLVQSLSSKFSRINR